MSKVIDLFQQVSEEVIICTAVIQSYICSLSTIALTLNV
jgi:hypothetical protein